MSTQSFENAVAIDFCEDVEPLSQADIARIKNIFEQEGAVANVHDFAGALDAEPTWVAQNRGSAGFVEIANVILAARNQ
jgi:hypothetical protein